MWMCNATAHAQRLLAKLTLLYNRESRPSLPCAQSASAYAVPLGHALGLLLRTRYSLSPLEGTGPNGSCRNFSPSLKGRSTRQTASTRVGELSIRYMRPFRTSLTEIYSYGTTVHMSILSRRFMRRAQIMPTSRLARATGSQCHHAHSTDPCRAR